ncbi:hypothetical protein C8F01DRAFT_1365129 [Mycena amicta]|nr:hypothetical protein C8F01DRAFT_1365129 [Mycena amicta]
MSSEKGFPQPQFHHAPSEPPPNYVQSNQPASGFRLALNSATQITKQDLERAGPAPFHDLGGEPMYIGSALMMHDDQATPKSVHPCKIGPHLYPSPCSVPYGGGEHSHHGRYDLLLFDEATMEWVPTSHGRIPEGRTPIEGGYEENIQQKLYHARGRHNNLLIPGKAGLHLRSCHVSFGGGEIAIAESYDILCWRLPHNFGGSHHQRHIFARNISQSGVLWRSERPFKQLIFKRELPFANYAGGDANLHCVQQIAPEFTFCEDATSWESSVGGQKVLVSCDANRKQWNTVLGPLQNPEGHGSLWISSADAAAPERLQLKDFPSGHDFHPLGLAISPYRGDAPSNLFVVNHGRERSVIEQFTLSPGSLVATHIRTLSSPSFIAPNSIALTSPNSFYVSNDHLMTRRLPYPFSHVLPVVETMLGLPFGWVSHVTLDPNPAANNIESTLAAPFIPFANGVAVSPSHTKVAVASTSLSAVYFYARNETTNALTATHFVPLPFHPDNLEFDHTGALIVAGHAHFGSLLKVKADSTGQAVAPSWAVSISDDNKVTTLFQSNGTMFSSSTTGLRDVNGAFYLTGLYAAPGGMLVCK